MPFDTVKLTAQLARHEGLRLKPYRDTTGHLTIGYGRNLDDVGITEYEAMVMLKGDQTRTMLALDTALPWWQTLDDVRSRVLIDMAFNMGIGTLLTFVGVLGRLRSCDWEGAAQHMEDSLWARQVGQRAKTLARMMRTGEDPHDEAHR